jgi:hypothetical protein
LSLSVGDLGTFHSAPPPVGGYQTDGDLATPNEPVGTSALQPLQNLSVPLHYSLYRTRHVVIIGKTNVLGVNPLTPNGPYSGHTAPLTSKVAFYIFIQQI